jgi:zinc-ribbon domain
MDTVICPKCGTENPTSAMDCRQCGINLQFAAEHPELFEGTKPEATQPEAGSTKQPVSRGKKVRDLLVGFVAWFAVSSLVAWLAGTGNPEFSSGGLCLTPLNIVALICLAFRWRWLALGWLVAYALNLIAALAISQMGSGAACGLPFFMSSW